MMLQLRDVQSGSDSARSLARGNAAFWASRETFVPIRNEILKPIQELKSRALSYEFGALPVAGQVERHPQQHGSVGSAPPNHASTGHFNASRAIEVLREFREEDSKDQQETLQFLIEALDEQRPGGCKLFSKP